ncbi:MAG TPA: metallopeptidase TldD-related protein [Bryobacteraceae bacterium]|nr:metallopeptidase TldD-related protein [Bryobacteraceae bacterium]
MTVQELTLEQIASDAVQQALAGGATDAECTISEGEEFSVSVRMQEVENLKEAGSRGAGIRVLTGEKGAQRAASSYTSDLSPDGIEKMVKAALALAKITSVDPFGGLPEPSELGKLEGDLKLYDAAIAKMTTEWKIDQAMRAEKAAFDFDARIQLSEGASFDSHIGRRIFANSLGFLGSYRTSSCSLSVVPVAKQDGAMERDYWHTSARSSGRLESPESVGRIAAERAIRRLNARKVPTQKVPVIFEPRTAGQLLGDIFGAVNGGAIYRHASFLAGKLGEKIASDALTVVDDATIPGLFGTTPFDDEGVASRRTVVIERGVLKSYLLNTYSARKLNLKTTGNASRGITGNAGIGPGNFFIEAGVLAPADVIANIPSGLYVTELIGGGANTVTGDYSSGAAGLWIENGKLTYPVSEITIAGTMQQMLQGIEQVGSDLEFRGSIAAPTISIREMTISGQ